MTSQATQRQAFLKGFTTAISREWIPVEDNLPEDYEEVLYCCVNETGRTEIMTGHREDNCWTHCCCFYSTTKLNDLVKVTHWMPLPLAPASRPEFPDN